METIGYTLPIDSPLVTAILKTDEAAKWADGNAFEREPKSQAKWIEQANANAIVIGLPEAGSVCECTKGWTYGIDLEKCELLRLGLGRFAGDVGCVETRFNPWLYSDRVDDAPRSTLLVWISGTTSNGVELARKAFLNGMNNGIVLAPSARRIETSILDLDPSDEPPPADVLRRLSVPKNCVYAGWSQCPAQEYRAYLDWGAKKEPRRVWRIKYLTRDSLKSASGATWANSPLLQAFGNAVTIADFVTEAEAKRVLENLPANGMSYPKDEVGYGEGAVGFSVDGSYLIMSSLPSEVKR